MIKIANVGSVAFLINVSVVSLIFSRLRVANSSGIGIGTIGSPSIISWAETLESGEITPAPNGAIQ